MILRAWHYAAAAVAFASFGAAALLLSLLVLPLLRLWPGTREERELRCQRAVQRAFRIYLAAIEAMGVVRLRILGAEELARPGQLVVANHPTLLDAVFVMSRMPQADCVAKQATWSNPFMRGVVRSTGYLSNALGAELVEACAERLRAGRSVLLFPEGTRSPRGALGPFQRGTAHVALRAGCPLRTVVITCTPPALDRARRWYQMPTQRLEVRIDATAALDPRDLCEPGVGRGVAARRITAALRDFYAKRLQVAAR